MASVMNLSGYVVVGHDHPQADVFTVISVHIVGMFGLVLVVGQLVDRVGRRRTLIAGLLVMAVSTVMLAWVVSIQALSISLFLLGLGWNLSYVAASAELVTHAKPGRTGTTRGVHRSHRGVAGGGARPRRRACLLGVGRRRARCRRDGCGDRSRNRHLVLPPASRGRRPRAGLMND